MSFRKRATRARFQLAFEAKSGGFVRELNRHDNSLRPMHQGLAERSRVMPVKPLHYVSGHANVVERRIGLTTEHVYEAFADANHASHKVHLSGRSKVRRFFRFDVLTGQISIEANYRKMARTAGASQRASGSNRGSAFAGAIMSELRRDSFRANTDSLA